ncbi:biotin/lipoyl-binding protein [Pseudorhodoferax sp. Leaf267]|uniref:biotin/lipoyl-binding protein n=1 Tax=Pseudorhodoferax sp. Leaf267 TaxID=1736316 RepID=UPI0012E2B53E|nr:biotin/lipoyl-binding protein [Pseudorhodoferax sp. Leaf267]
MKLWPARPAERGTPDAPASLFNPRWHRVAGLKPQLRGHVQIDLQVQRGTPFYVLRDLTNDNAQRLNTAAYAFVGRCDGQATVQQIWDAVLQAHPEEAMSQTEAIELLVALHGRGLMQFDVPPDVEALFHAQNKRRRKRRLTGVNPMAFRLPLGDPSWLLEPLRRFAPVLFSPLGFALWLLAVGAGLLGTAMHWDALVPYADKVLYSPGYLLLGWLSYPFIKVLHEAAHGLALMRYGGRVHSAGITLIVLNPVPFVDASAADGLRSRYQRALISAAGIMAELLIAAIALALWLAVQPGLVRDMAFIVLLTAGLSTLLTNGNPLLRYDGYFVLCDLLDLRNLATRSGRYWAEGLNRRLFGVPARVPVEPLPGERWWLRVYAPASWVYRLVLSIVVALWIGSISTLMGVFVGGLMLAANTIFPMRRMLLAMRGGLQDGQARGRAYARVAGVGLALLALLAWLPVPFTSVAQGVVWLPEHAQIRAGTEGFVVRLAATDGQRVQAGALIAVLQDEHLVARRASLAGDLAETDVRLYHAIASAPEEAPDLREKLAYSQAELARVDEKLALREVRAQADGVLVLPPGEEILGQFRKRGESIGYLLTEAAQVVRVALPQRQADLVRSRQGDIHVRLMEDDRSEHAGRIALQVPGTLARLPSAALGDFAGGDIPTDPGDKDGVTPRQPVVVMDIALDQPAGERFGARALVRFDHGTAPIASQALRGLQQLLLGHFSPTT